jgi:hypothetical protein
MSGRQLRQTLADSMAEGESRTLVSAVYADPAEGEFAYRLQPVGDSAAVVTGADEALFTVGRFSGAPFVEGGLSIDASAAHFRKDRICMMHGQRVSSTRVVLEATVPVSLVWDLGEGTIALECSEDGEMVLALAPDARVTLDGRPAQLQGDDPAGLRLQPGRHVIEGATPREDVITMLDDIISGLLKTEGPGAPQLAARTEAPEWPAAWIADLQAKVTHIQVTLAGEGEEPTIWAATEPPGISRLSADGEVMGTTELPAKVNALQVTPAQPGADGVVAVAGGDDDFLRAFSASGEVLWEAESKVSEDFKVGDRYNAPWFTDPERKSGIRSLMIADVTGPGQPEIVLGRPSTLEYWGLDGKLIARLPIKWGDCTELALLEQPDGPRVLVGKFFSGIDGISLLDTERKVIGTSGYLGLPQGSTRMSAWMQRGTVAVRALDLDGDGVQEVVVARSGHWNDVRAFDAAGNCLWQRSFGPARPRSRFVRDVAVGELDGDASLEVACGMANGWVCCFDADGAVLWTRKFGSPVTKLLPASGQFVVGLESGGLALLDAAGETVKAADLGSELTSLTTTEGRWPGDTLVLAGTTSGTLLALRP